jgi:class 3 adenylate cyclase/tetratricopeptide (TPR) repeat protein
MTSSRLARQVARLLDACEAAISDGDWDRAGQFADSALRLDPENEDAVAYLAAAHRGAPATLDAPPPPARPAERRQMTVMFCDLVDSTPLAEQLDPEDLRDILRAYHEACDRVVQRFGGYVAHYMGDGLLVYFGYPHAQEDASARAVMAGLEIVRAVPALRKHTEGTPGLEARVGIHHGLVVVGEMGSGTRIEPSDIVGRTPNLAARLQSVAAAGTVLVSGELAKLVGREFDLEPAGRQQLKGIAQPVETWSVLSVANTSGRELAAESVIAPLVGRGRELRTLKRSWRNTVDGVGHVAVLRGEAGIGKTRLVRALREYATEQAHTIIDLRCSALHQGSALYPVLEHLGRRVLLFTDDDADEDRVARIRSEISRWPEADQAAVDLLTSAFVLPTTSPSAAISPQERKERTFEMLASWVIQVSAASPVLLSVEDLHWVDPSTLELLLLVIERTQGHRVMTCVTARPGFTLVWPQRPTLVEFDLTRLSPRDAELLASRLPAAVGIPDGVRSRIVAHSDGVPLFIEELIRSLAATDSLGGSLQPAGAANPVDVPASLHDSLMARLDRMGTARRVAQVGSTLGRQFSFDLLQSLGELDASTLAADLERLIGAGILSLRGSGGRLEYGFRHALIQDVAYQSLLRTERARLHGRIAEAYERDFPRAAERELEVVAHHWAEAHQTGRAIDYLVRAGESAIARFANQEAVSLLDRALELIKATPAGIDRDRVELRLRLAVGGPLVATRGYADPEVEQNYARAVELCSRDDRAPDRFQAMWGLRRFYQVRGNFQRSVALASELLEAAGALDGTAAMLADAAAGDALWLTGDLRSAGTHLEACAARLDAGGELTLQARDACTRALAEHAVVLWLAGDPRGAAATAERAIAEARAIGDPFLVCWAVTFGAWVAQLAGDAPAVRSGADETHALALRYGFKYFEAVGMVFGGWCAANSGDDPGLVRISAGVELYNRIGAESALTYFEALRATAALTVSRPDWARDFVDSGLTTARKNGERAFLPELLRLGAEAAVPGQPPGAESLRLIEQALQVAREIGAPALGLRATLTLSRVSGSGERVHRLLGEFLSDISPAADSAEISRARLLLTISA